MPLRFFALSGLFALTFVVFSTVLFQGFVNWDDGYNFVNNPGFKLPFAQSISWAWSADSVGNFHPLTWHLLWAQAKLFGFSPGVFHFVSVALHSANTVLICHLVWRLLPGPQFFVPTLLASLLFSLHPLRVEMVAWASCQPHLWSVFFALLAARCYLDERGKTALLLFVFASLSKAIVITLPVLLLFLPHRRGENWRETLALKFPKAEWGYWIVALSVGLATLAARDLTPAVPKSTALYDVLSRLLNPLSVVGQAITQTLWPANLFPIYPIYPPLLALLYGSLAILVLGFCLYEARHQLHARFFLWGFLILLFPQMLSAATETLSFADRYTYLPFLLLVAPFAWVFGQLALALPRLRIVGVLIAGLCLGLLVYRTRAQILVWGDSESLWRQILVKGYSPNAKALHNLGTALMEKGKFQDAEVYLHRSLALNGNDVDTLNSLGVCALMTHRLADSLSFLRKAVALPGSNPEAMNNLAHVLSLFGEHNEALTWIERVLLLQPRHSRFLENRARIFNRMGRLDESLTDWLVLSQSEPFDPVVSQEIARLTAELTLGNAQQQSRRN